MQIIISPASGERNKISGDWRRLLEDIPPPKWGKKPGTLTLGKDFTVGRFFCGLCILRRAVGCFFQVFFFCTEGMCFVSSSCLNFTPCRHLRPRSHTFAAISGALLSYPAVPSVLSLTLPCGNNVAAKKGTPQTRCRNGSQRAQGVGHTKNETKQFVLSGLQPRNDTV